MTPLSENKATYAHLQYNTECPICIKQFTSCDVKQILCCRHAFHAKCFAQVLKSKNFLCPICKRVASLHSTKNDHDTETTCRNIIPPLLKNLEWTENSDQRLDFVMECLKRYIKDLDTRLIGMFLNVLFTCNCTQIPNLPEKIAASSQNQSVENMFNMFDMILDFTIRMQKN